MFLIIQLGLESDLAQSKPNRTHHSTQLSNTRFSFYNEQPQRDSNVCNDELSKVQTIICDTLCIFMLKPKAFSTAPLFLKILFIYESSFRTFHDIFHSTISMFLIRTDILVFLPVYSNKGSIYYNILQFQARFIYHQRSFLFQQLQNNQFVLIFALAFSLTYCLQ